MQRRCPRWIVLTMLCCSLSLTLSAQPGSDVQKLIKAVEDQVKAKDPNVGELKLMRTRLEKELPALKAKAEAASATEADKEWYSRADAAFKEVQKKIKGIDGIVSFIKSTKPMTAVLLSWQQRNTFEVVKDPASTDATIGIINQNQTGSTGGVLIAAEALFAQPKGFSKDKYGRRSKIPVGAWFGVNLKTGGGDEVSDVDLALGLSFSFISASRLVKMREEDEEFSGSARLLLGAVYGEVAELGPRDASTALQVGDPYPLGESPPLKKDKKISFTIGIGFRF